MRVKHNPLMAVLGLTPDGIGDPWADMLVVLAVPVDHPLAAGRQLGLHTTSRLSSTLVYAGNEPDLSCVPSGVKVILLSPDGKRATTSGRFKSCWDTPT